MVPEETKVFELSKQFEEMQLGLETNVLPPVPCHQFLFSSEEKYLFSYDFPDLFALNGPWINVFFNDFLIVEYYRRLFLFDDGFFGNTCTCFWSKYSRVELRSGFFWERRSCTGSLSSMSLAEIVRIGDRQVFQTRRCSFQPNMYQQLNT